MPDTVFQITGTDDGLIRVQSGMPPAQMEDIIISMAFRIAMRRGEEFSETDAEAVKLAFAQSHVAMDRAERVLEQAERIRRRAIWINMFVVGIALWNVGRVFGWWP
jgi:hypothetical protein